MNTPRVSSNTAQAFYHSTLSVLWKNRIMTCLVVSSAAVGLSIIYYIFTQCSRRGGTGGGHKQGEPNTSTPETKLSASTVTASSAASTQGSGNTGTNNGTQSVSSTMTISHSPPAATSSSSSPLSPTAEAQIQTQPQHPSNVLYWRIVRVFANAVDPKYINGAHLDLQCKHKEGTIYDIAIPMTRQGDILEAAFQLPSNQIMSWGVAKQGSVFQQTLPLTRCDSQTAIHTFSKQGEWKEDIESPEAPQDRAKVEMSVELTKSQAFVVTVGQDLKPNFSTPEGKKVYTLRNPSNERHIVTFKMEVSYKAPQQGNHEVQTQTLSVPILLQPESSVTLPEDFWERSFQLSMGGTYMSLYEIVAVKLLSVQDAVIPTKALTGPTTSTSALASSSPAAAASSSSSQASATAGTQIQTQRSTPFEGSYVRIIRIPYNEIRESYRNGETVFLQIVREKERRNTVPMIRYNDFLEAVVTLPSPQVVDCALIVDSENTTAETLPNIPCDQSVAVCTFKKNAEQKWEVKTEIQKSLEAKGKCEPKISLTGHRGLVAIVGEEDKPNISPFSNRSSSGTPDTIHNRSKEHHVVLLEMQFSYYIKAHQTETKVLSIPIYLQPQNSVSLSADFWEGSFHKLTGHAGNPILPIVLLSVQDMVISAEELQNHA